MGDIDRKTPGPGNLPAPVEISSSIALTPAPGLPTTVNIDLLTSPSTANNMTNAMSMTMVPSSASLRPSQPSPMPQLTSSPANYSTSVSGGTGYESKESLASRNGSVEAKLPMTPTNANHNGVNSSPSTSSLIQTGNGNGVGLPGYNELRSPTSSSTLAIGAQRRSPNMNDPNMSSHSMYQSQGRAIVASASSTLPRTPGTLPLSSPSGAGTVNGSNNSALANGSYQRASTAATAASSAAAALVGASTIISASGSSSMLPPPGTSHGSRPVSSHGNNNNSGAQSPHGNTSPMMMTSTTIGVRPGTTQNGRGSGVMLSSSNGGGVGAVSTSSSSTALPSSASRRPQQVVYDYDEEEADEESQAYSTHGSLMYRQQQQNLVNQQQAQRPQTRSGIVGSNGMGSRPTTSAGLQTLNGNGTLMAGNATMTSNISGSSSPRSMSRASAAATPTPVAVPSSSHSKRRAAASQAAVGGSSTGASTPQPNNNISSSANNGSNSARSKSGRESNNGSGSMMPSPSHGSRTMGSSSSNSNGMGSSMNIGGRSMIATSTTIGNSTPAIGVSQTARSGSSNSSSSAVQSILAPVVAGSARVARKRPGIHGLLGSSTPVTPTSSNGNGSMGNGNGSSNPTVPALLVSRAMPSSSPLRPIPSGATTPSRSSGGMMTSTRAM
jgi:hypothetical protein